MIDIITYIPDLSVFRLEAQTKASNKVHGFCFSESGELIYNVSKIPVHYSADGVRSICLIRLMTQKDIPFQKFKLDSESFGL